MLSIDHTLGPHYVVDKDGGVRFEEGMASNNTLPKRWVQDVDGMNGHFEDCPESPVDGAITRERQPWRCPLCCGCGIEMGRFGESLEKTCKACSGSGIVWG